MKIKDTNILSSQPKINRQIHCPEQLLHLFEKTSKREKKTLLYILNYALVAYSTNGNQSKRLKEEYIREKFNQYKKEIYKELRNWILDCTNKQYIKKGTNDHFPEGKCREYLLREERVKYLLDKFYSKEEVNDPKLIVENSKKTFDKEKQQYPTFTFGDFSYYEKEIGDRLYNTYIQSIPKTKRGSMLQKLGYKFEEDTVCSMPTVMQQFMLNTFPSEIQNYIFNEQYINNSERWREEIANDLKISTKFAKSLLLAVQNGSDLCDFAPVWEENINEIYFGLRDKCRRHYFIAGLKKEFEYRINLLRNSEYNIPELNDSQLFSKLYRMEERKIANAKIKYFQSKDCKFIYMFDGFTLENWIDPEKLSQFIFIETGYSTLSKIKELKDSSFDNNLIPSNNNNSLAGNAGQTEVKCITRETGHYDVKNIIQNNDANSIKNENSYNIDTIAFQKENISKIELPDHWESLSLAEKWKLAKQLDDQQLF